ENKNAFIIHPSPLNPMPDGPEKLKEIKIPAPGTAPELSIFFDPRQPLHKNSAPTVKRHADQATGSAQRDTKPAGRGLPPVRNILPAFPPFLRHSGLDPESGPPYAPARPPLTGTPP